MGGEARNLRWLWLTVAVIALDQATKQWALAALVPYQPLDLLPSFSLTLMFNTGAAFSFLSEAGGWQRWGLSGLALLVSLVLVLWLWRLPRGQWRTGAALALVIGGAVGNLWDRVAYGHVVDFLDVYYQQWHWPAFNLADSAITLGAVLLVWEALFGGRPPEPGSSNAAEGEQ